MALRPTVAPSAMEFRRLGKTGLKVGWGQEGRAGAARSGTRSRGRGRSTTHPFSAIAMAFEDSEFPASTWLPPSPFRRTNPRPRPLLVAMCLGCPAGTFLLTPLQVSSLSYGIWTTIKSKSDLQQVRHSMHHLTDATGTPPHTHTSTS